MITKTNLLISLGLTSLIFFTTILLSQNKSPINNKLINEHVIAKFNKHIQKYNVQINNPSEYAHRL